MLNYKSFIFLVLILGLGVSLLENGFTAAKENHTNVNCSRFNHTGDDHASLLKTREKLNCSHDENISNIEKIKSKRRHRAQKRNRRSKREDAEKGGEDEKLMSYFVKLTEKAGKNVRKGTPGKGSCAQQGCHSSFSKLTDTSSGHTVTKLKCGVKEKHNTVEKYEGVLYEIQLPGHRGFKPIVGITKNMQIWRSSKSRFSSIYHVDTHTAKTDWEKKGIYKLTLDLPRGHDDCKKSRGTYKCIYFLKLKSKSEKYQREENTLNLTKLPCKHSHHGHKLIDTGQNLEKLKEHGKEKHHKKPKSGRSRHHHKNGTEHHHKKNSTAISNEQKRKKKLEENEKLLRIIIFAVTITVIVGGIIAFCVKCFRGKKKKKGKKKEEDLDDMNDKKKEKKKSRESKSNLRSKASQVDMPIQQHNRASYHSLSPRRSMNRASGHGRNPSAHNVESQPEMPRMNLGLMNQIHKKRID